LKVYFCDHCNESVPLTDLESGVAALSGDRVLCERCRPPTLASARGRHVAWIGALFGGLVGALAGAWSAVMVVRSGSSREAVGAPQPELDGLRRDVATALESIVALRDSFDALHDRSEEESSTGEGSALPVLDDVEPRLLALETAVAEAMQARDGAVTDPPPSSGGDARVEATVERVATLELRLLAIEESLTALEAAVRRGGMQRTTAPSGGAPAEGRSPVGERSRDPRDAARWEDLLGKLTDTDPGVRWESVEGLANTGDPRAVTYLIRALADPDPFVRRQAAKGLGTFGERSAIAPLLDRLEDDEEIVRESAHESLRLLTLESIPFDPAAPAKNRARDVGRWREWWASQPDAAPGG